MNEDQFAFTLREFARAAGAAIAQESHGELVTTHAGLTYAKRVDVEIPIMVFDPKTRRNEIRMFRIRGTLHL